MNALQLKDRDRKEVIQVSTRKNDIKVQYLYDTTIEQLRLTRRVKFGKSVRKGKEWKLEENGSVITDEKNGRRLQLAFRKEDGGAEAKY